MTCDSILKLIPLYYYGELTPDEEERVEEHTHACPGCTRDLAQQRALAAALDRRALVPAPLLLSDCRSDLMAAIQGGAPRIEPVGKGPWRLFLDALSSSFVGVGTGMGRLRQPIGALALISIGFFAARLVYTAPPTEHGGSLLSSLTSPTDDVYSTVRSVQPDNAGGVAISLDETRRKVVKGNMNDRNIQRLIMAGVHEDNPAVRVESVDLLRSQSGSTEVRDALLNALTDTNAGVRLKALEGLKPLAADSEVRKGLRRVLATDDNVPIRMLVIDLLVANRDDNMVGMMQSLVQKENNNSVRLKLEKALRDMNASIGTF